MVNLGLVDDGLVGLITIEVGRKWRRKNKRMFKKKFRRETEKEIKQQMEEINNGDVWHNYTQNEMP